MIHLKVVNTFLKHGLFSRCEVQTVTANGTRQTGVHLLQIVIIRELYVDVITSGKSVQFCSLYLVFHSS